MHRMEKNVFIGLTSASAVLSILVSSLYVEENLKAGEFRIVLFVKKRI